MPADPPAYLFLSEEHVPPRWRERARRLALVPLLPEEVSSLLAPGEVRVALDPREESLAGLVAGGLPISAIAREMGEPLRTVQRRVARLRGRFGVRSTSELAAALAARGFGPGRDRPSGDAGASPNMRKKNPARRARRRGAGRGD